MSELIKREDVRREIQASFDRGVFRWQDGLDLMGRINALPTASQWHRVEDEMPDLLQFVVVCNDDGKFVVAQYVGYQTDSLTPWRIAYTMYDTDIYDEKECGPVRYWMPIKPPTGTERSETWAN